MICLDTHTLLWIALAPELLSKKAFQMINSQQDEAIYVSDITIWEIAILVAKNRITLPIDYIDFLELLFESRNIKIVSISPAIAKLATIIDLPHKDPADRLICATAISLHAKLITKDDKILKAKVVDAVW